MCDSLAGGGLLPHIWEATCCTTTASGQHTMSRSETKTERSEVVESLTRTTHLSGDGRDRLCGCLTFHREQKTTQLAAWGMLAWPEVSYLVSLISLKSYRSILKRTLDVNLVFA